MPSVKVSTQAIMLQMAAAKEFGDANYAQVRSSDRRRCRTPMRCWRSPTAPPASTRISRTSPFLRAGDQAAGHRVLLTTNYEILGGPATARGDRRVDASFATPTPRSYKAFFDALKEAIDTINKDKRAAAKVYLEQAKDTKNSVDDIYAMINATRLRVHADAAEGRQDRRVHVQDRHRSRPSRRSWKDLFFPEVQSLPGD